MTSAAHVVRRGAGTPLVMIHGNGVDHRLLLPLDSTLSDSGPWERIYIDLPGFGETPALGEPAGLPDLADWLCEVVTELVGGRKFAVLGNSLGGLLAGHVASVFGNQVIGVALLAPVVHPRPRDRSVPQRCILHRDQPLLDSLDPADAHEFEQMVVHQTPDAWTAFRDAALPGIRSVDEQASLRLARRYRLGSEAGELVGQVTAPTLILTGRQDHIVGFEDQEGLLKRYLQATHIVLDGAGHNIHLDQSGPVASHLRDWTALVLGRFGTGVSEGLYTR